MRTVTVILILAAIASVPTSIFFLTRAKHAMSPQVTGMSGARFNMPKCHKLPDGLTECSMKNLTREQREREIQPAR